MLIASVPLVIGMTMITAAWVASAVPPIRTARSVTLTAEADYLAALRQSQPLLTELSSLRVSPVQELEAESLRDWDKKQEQLEDSVPRVPFGKANAEWKAFLRQLRTGDKLFMYDEGCCTGIIIVRRGCIVDWFQTWES